MKFLFLNQNHFKSLMLQRIQTIYIFIFAILFFISPFFTFVEFDVKQIVNQLEKDSSSDLFNAFMEDYQNDKLFVELKQLSLLPSGLKGDLSILPSNYTFPKYIIMGYLIAVSFSILMLVNFKKRSKQLRFGKLLYIIVFITVAYMIVESYNMKILLEEQKDIELINQVYHIGFYLLISSLPFLFLANRGIKKDDDLIKSLDRLR